MCMENMVHKNEHTEISEQDMYEALCERHSPEVQKKLADGHVAIAGLGGLGQILPWRLQELVSDICT